jgi:hypothetical protein
MSSTKSGPPGPPGAPAGRAAAASALPMSVAGTGAVGDSAAQPANTSASSASTPFHARLITFCRAAGTPVAAASAALTAAPLAHDDDTDTACVSLPHLTDKLKEDMAEGGGVVCCVETNKEARGK